MPLKPKSLFLSTTALALLSWPALAQDQTPPHFGESAEAFSGDGVCSDPRFEGSGMAEAVADDARMQDSADCSAAFESGTITLIAQTEENTAEKDAAEVSTDAAAAVPTQGTETEAETDGEEATNVTEDETDIEAGSADMAEEADEETADNSDAEPVEDATQDEDEGATQDDADEDDPVTVEEAADEAVSDAPEETATAGAAAQAEAGEEPGSEEEVVTVDEAGTDESGDTSEEEDRTAGTEVEADSDVSGADDAFRDTAAEASAQKTEKAGAEEDVSSSEDSQPIVFNGVTFGDNASEWANDGECDDPRFAGEGMTATRLLDSDAFHDADDCLAAWRTGGLRLADD